MSNTEEMELPTVSENALPTVLPVEGELTISLTDRAIAKTKVFLADNDEQSGKVLRVYIEGGGCSGFNYRFKFDEQVEDDLVFDEKGIIVVVDPNSMQYLKGSVVDYVDDFTRSGFEIKNPNASSTCGCGESFSI